MVKKGRMGSKAMDRERPSKKAIRSRRSKRVWTGPMAVALLCLMLGSVIGAGAMVYNHDFYYFGDRTNLTVNLPDVLVSGSQTPFVIMTETKEGVPKADQDVTIALRSGDGQEVLFKGHTNGDGMVVADVDVPEVYGKAELVIEAGGETLVKDIGIVNSTGSPKAKVLISTDKPIYQPGQTIHIRTLSFGGLDFMASPGSIELQVTDPNGDRIFRENIIANDYGIASYDFPLADYLPLGSYVIRASLSPDIYTDLPVVVKRYVLPKFKIQLEDVSPWYLTGDQLHGTINASYMFGEPVKGSVEIEARTIENEAYKDRWYKKNWVEFGNILDEKHTLVNGEASFFLKFGDRSYDRYDRYYEYAAYTVEINVTVTDQAGHSESESYEIEVAQTPYRAVILADSFMNGEDCKIFMIIIDPAGEPIPEADISLGYNNGDGKRTFKTTTDDKGIGLIELPYQGSGSLDLTISKDDLYSKLSYSLTGDSMIKVDGDDRSFEPGETASFNVVFDPWDTGTSDGHVYYEVSSEGMSILGGQASLSGGRGKISFPVMDIMAPASEIKVVKVLADGSVVHDAVMFTVERPMDLNVRITPVGATYRPGEAIRFNFAVSDPSADLGGPAALGVKIVDQSVYELGERLVSQDEVFRGLRWSSQGPKYDVAMYAHSPDAPVPTVEGVVYEHQEVEGGSSIHSSFAEYMEMAKDRKEDMIQGYWTALALGGIAGFIVLLGRGMRTKRIGRRRRGPGLIIVGTVVVVIAVFLLSGTFVVYLTSNSFGPAGSDSAGLSGLGGLEERDTSAKESGDALSGGGFPDFSFPKAGEEKKPTGSGLVTFERKLSIRDYFPETWYWNPYLITDEDGKAHIDLETPDTITTWGIDAAASTKDGRFGIGQANLTVFQEFFVEPDLPPYMIRNDTVELPVLVYNYMEQEENITVTMKREDWLDVHGNTSTNVVVPPESTRSVNFTVTTKEVGTYKMTVGGMTATINDVVIKDVLVRPDGRLVNQIFNGELEDTDSETRTIVQDPERINRSEMAYVKLIGSMAGVALDGAESFLQFAYGCGEQSTSIFSVNLAAYRNLQIYNADQEVLDEVEKYVHQSIQYEAQFLMNAGGGRAIAWHPGEPADMWLTTWASFAYRDAEKAGFGVDTRILDGIETYLLSLQGTDGSWDFPDVGHWSINNDLLNKKVVGTAYVLRALQYAGHGMDSKVKKGIDYIASHLDMDDSPYALAMALLVFSSADRYKDLQDNIAAKLVGLKEEDTGSEGIYWEYGREGGYYSYRRTTGTEETTAYATLALAAYGGYTNLVTKALSYLLSIRQYGRWGNTHSTAVVLQALNMEGAFSAKDMTVTVKAEGRTVDTVRFTEDNNDLVFYVDLRPYMAPDNTTKVDLSSVGEGTVVYQVVYEENIPWDAFKDEVEDIKLSAAALKRSLDLGEATRLSLTVTYTGDRDMLKMVLVEVPMAPGFVFQEYELEDMVGDEINDFEVVGGMIIRFYIDGLRPNDPVTMTFDMTPTLKGDLTMQGVRVYDMYDAGRTHTLQPLKFTVG